nr:MAG TPA: tail component [Caudoviricetes sp.]
MSPVGNPEIWAANVAHREANSRAADDYDFKVAVRNTLINLNESNFTKAGNLKRGVKYAKPLTKTERDQNFSVNGLVAGRDYVGGRFRANWNFSIGSVDNSFRIHPDPTGTEATARLVAGAIEFKAGQTAFIVNNLPYAIPLEFGHSTQAPGGMVRVTVARFQQIVLEAIRNNQV